MKRSSGRASGQPKNGAAGKAKKVGLIRESTKALLGEACVALEGFRNKGIRPRLADIGSSIRSMNREANEGEDEMPRQEFLDSSLTWIFTLGEKYGAVRRERRGWALTKDWEERLDAIPVISGSEEPRKAKPDIQALYERLGQIAEAIGRCERRIMKLSGETE